MVWRAEDKQGHESDKIKYEIVPFTRGTGLDVGCGTNKPFAHFLSVDDGSHAEMFDFPVRADIHADGSRLGLFASNSLDFVFSSHVLEHIEDYRAALIEWWRVIKPGGHLVLYLPHKLFYPNVGVEGANPDHKHDFLPMDIQHAMEDISEHCGQGWDLLRDEDRNERDEYSFFQVYRKRHDAIHTRPCLDAKPGKTVCLVRYGGFGDMLQTSAVLPELKRAGFHVTMMTTPKGQDILREDPYIDSWIIQDHNQVPNEELGPYWATWRKRFDRWVNFSESVEVTLLAIPGRTNHLWPESVRRKRLNVNYGEWMAELAEVPFAPDVKFYPSVPEQHKAANYLLDMRREAAQGLQIGARTPPAFVVQWVLAGSSVHKFYPNMDTVIARMMLELPHSHVVFNGDAVCMLLEQGWEKEARVHRESGKMSIRDSLALAQQVSCVVGPETGVLNAVAFEPVRKVVLLSHSSRENLTKHWTNTAALQPNVPCYPCHRMHYTREFCPEDHATGASICAVSIPADEVFAAIKVEYDRWAAANKLKEAA